MIPFWVAILATVVGLLIVTGGFLIFYDLQWGQRSIELLKAYYLDQVADTAEKEVAEAGAHRRAGVAGAALSLRDRLLYNGRRHRAGADAGSGASSGSGHRGNQLPGEHHRPSDERDADRWKGAHLLVCTCRCGSARRGFDPDDGTPHRGRAGVVGHRTPAASRQSSVRRGHSSAGCDSPNRAGL